MKKLYSWLRKHVLGIDGRSQLEIAISNGLTLGEGCAIMGECVIDPGHCFLISIGDRVTLAPRVHILAHDASTKRELGYTRIAPVRIGSDVFIGAGSVILPGVTIGDKVIIGAGSVVSRSIPSGSVAVGNPCRVISSYEEYMEKRREEFSSAPKFGQEYRIDLISNEGKEDMKSALQWGSGYIL